MQKFIMTLCTALLLTACSTTTSPVMDPVESPIPDKGSNKPMSQKESEKTAKTPELPTPAPEPVPTSVSSVRYSVNPKSNQITNIDKPDEKILLLTFDDGPTGASTTEILHTLDRHKAKAIWFVNGHQIANKKKDGTFEVKPDKAALLLEIKKRGHIIGNHTWWHENLRKLPAEKQREEIISTNDLVEKIVGDRPKYFRPPFGAYTPISKQVCEEQGMLSMNWSVGSLDWEPKVYKQQNAITNQVMATVHEGGNILFHDRTWTAAELESILTNLEKKQYKFVLPTNDK